MLEWMFRNMKMGLCGILTALMFLQLLNTTCAFSCSYDVLLVKVSLRCPMLFQDKDKVFCCDHSDLPYCCDINEFIRINTAILAGIIVGVIVLLLIVLIISCYCCSCCPLAKSRRQQRGTVLYAPQI